MLEISKQYEKERLDNNKHMQLITDKLNDIFSNDSNIIYNGRQIGFKIIESTKFIKKSLVKYATGY